MREQYVARVAKKDAFEIEELRQLNASKSQYEGAYEANKKQDDEQKTYIASLEEIRQTEVKAVIGHFSEHEKAHSEKERIYHSYMREQTSESLDTFRSDLLHYLAGNIFVKEHRVRY